jgi:hypothetical protein
MFKRYFNLLTNTMDYLVYNRDIKKNGRSYFCQLTKEIVQGMNLKFRKHKGIKSEFASVNMINIPELNGVFIRPSLSEQQNDLVPFISALKNTITSDFGIPELKRKERIIDLMMNIKDIPTSVSDNEEFKMLFVKVKEKRGEMMLLDRKANSLNIEINDIEQNMAEIYHKSIEPITIISTTQKVGNTP